MAIYRVRRYSGTKGGSNYYFHADVIARSPASAMKAAREERVYNWRWVDRYDSSSEDYKYYELLYRVYDNGWGWNEAKKPAVPWTPEELAGMQKIWTKRSQEAARKEARRTTWRNKRAKAA